MERLTFATLQEAVDHCFNAHSSTDLMFYVSGSRSGGHLESHSPREAEDAGRTGIEKPPGRLKRS